MQKFVDQTISANTNYDPTDFDDHKVSMQQLLKDLLTAYKYGLKTLYYHNTRDQAGTSTDKQTGKKVSSPTTVVIEEDEGCEGGACKI